MTSRQRRLLPCLAIACFSLASSLAINANAAVAGSSGAIASRYVVRFAEPALGRYNGVASAMGQPAASLMPLKRDQNGRLRLDVASASARSYVAWLQGRQDQHLADIAAAIGRIPTAAYSMQHALNAAILALSADEARRIGAMPGVAAVDPDREFDLASDIGPGFTGAASVWSGTSMAPDSIFASSYDNRANLGDGVVIGMIDTGYNSLSPSFQAVDAKGYNIRNPLGHGVHLGQCGVRGISLGGCNDKVIGVYDEVGLTTATTNPVYSVEDVQGHGSHTASIAAGDERKGILDGYSALLSGVAPHANLVIYRACTPYTQCTGSAMIASIDQAIADGVVDVLNYSISDTASPWSDPVADAFLSATEAGIVVVAAGGNTDSLVPVQVAGSVNNTAPWIMTVGAGSHTGGAIALGARTPAQPDELAAFSLLGPAKFDAIKPDLQAPGVEILAATWNDGSAGGADRVAMMNGTSMATAHISGSAALLLGLHPDWAPLEVKSALMMTALESGLTKADGATASDYFDRGSGRVQEFAASRAGLVMNETGDHFANADPTWGVGDPGTLNLASMQNSACASACSFSRTFRSTQDHAVTWTVGIAAGPGSGFAAVSAMPNKFTVGALSSSAVTFNVNTNKLPADGTFHYAEVVLTPNDSRLRPLHLTIAVAVPAP